MAKGTNLLSGQNEPITYHGKGITCLLGQMNKVTVMAKETNLLSGQNEPIIYHGK